MLTVLLLLSGCAEPKPPKSVALVIEEVGQCVDSAKGMFERYGDKSATYACDNHIVVLGDPYVKEDGWYVNVGKLSQQKAQMELEGVCERKVLQRLASPCELLPATGSCRARFIKFYYNAEREACESFTWGGCGGVVPFHTLESCQRSCEKR